MSNIMQALHDVGLNSFAVTLLAESVLKSPIAAMTVGDPQRIAFPIARGDCPGWAGVRITVEAVPEADWANPWPLSASNRRQVEQLQANIARERGEHQVLARLLAECDKVLSTLEAESTDEQHQLDTLRSAILKATLPHRPEEADLLAVRTGLVPPSLDNPVEGNLLTAEKMLRDMERRPPHQQPPWLRDSAQQQVDPETDPPAREPSDWAPPIGWDGNGSIDAMATRAKEIKAAELADRYYNETEAYDRTVCSGPLRDGSIMPMGPHERALVMRNAGQVREQIKREAEAQGISRQEMAQAIRRCIQRRG